MISRNKLVYLGSAIAVGCVVFIGGLLIGRFAISRPEHRRETYDPTTDNRRVEEERNARWNQYKKQFLDSVNAQEIENNLRYDFISQENILVNI